MQRASNLFSADQRQQIEQAVAQAEATTSCEIVPVVATASGRYDRAEDILGLWLATISAIVVWTLYPRTAPEHGDWSGMTLESGLLVLVASIVVAFLAGGILGGQISWLRRLFTPSDQMKDEVATRSRQAFFDRRVHHTSGATGLLIYVSLFEHRAAILADQVVLEKLGQAKLDELCQQLTDGLHQGHPTQAICTVIQAAGQQLAQVLPRTEGAANQLPDALVLID
ncbi:hypothetical protein C5Y96_09280 [Blastopirellula marina]|uniref:TPM domain-containing protein n=1 Tax=Blastopirellula marina TaxID=124 RepID=A0A2S8FUU7_9BACT|nr:MULTISPECIES: hypothetical protein [Pirellulaceae]PQO35830.1 hypothetical protein C5Y96_09280 [Blastopirellula marina]RCS53405.1 hypothetical protein DTL36_09290 [Bremerella cremea]